LRVSNARELKGSFSGFYRGNEATKKIGKIYFYYFFKSPPRDLSVPRGVSRSDKVVEKI